MPPPFQKGRPWQRFNYPPIIKPVILPGRNPQQEADRFFKNKDFNRAGKIKKKVNVY
jgi:hypothetical protein